jgi:2',3'-cyclic-nucleotide 2'-phosphodiesterase (5'-nucleotidase family)
MSTAARTLSALIALLLGASSAPVLAAPGEPSEDPPEGSGPAASTVPFLLLGGFKGEFGLPDCRAEGGPTVRPTDYPRLVHAVNRILDGATGPAPLVLHSGDLHFPGAIPRHLVEGDDAGLDQLFGLIERIPYDGVGIGGLDLSLPSERVAPFFARADARDFPLLASNVTCEDGAPRPEVCAALGTAPGEEPFRVVERGGVRIAILSILDPAHADEIPAEKRRGLTFATFADAVPPLVARIRSEGLADLVVVQNHTHARAKELAVLEALPGIEGVDLVILKQLKDGVWGTLSGTAEGRDVGWSRVPGSGTTVLTAGRSVSQAVLAEVDIAPGEAGWTLAPRSARLIDVSAEEPDADAVASIDALGAAFCADWGRPIQPEVPLSAPMDAAGFQRYVLDAMRDEAHTELALLNAGALRNTDLLPTSEPLTRADLHALLPFGGELVKARVPGDLLWFFGGDTLVGGLERPDGSPKVNGRPIDPTRTYSVVMNRFVADGGDGILLPSKLKRREALLDRDGEPLEIVDLLTASLLEKRFVRRRTGTLDPTARHVDLSRRPLFRFSGSTNVSYSKIAVENPEVDGVPAYSKGELTTYAADRFSGDARLSISGDSRDHDFGGSVYLLYAFSEFAEELGGRFESGDWIRGTVNYDFAGLRSLAGDQGFVPVPFIEGQLQTEFDRPETRDWHRFELTAIAGARFRPLRVFTFMIGANVRHEVLQPDSRALGGIVLGYTLRRVTLFNIVKNPVDLESETSWFFNDIGQANIHEIRHFTRLSFQLFQKLYVTASATAYAYREQPVDAWGAYIDFTVGLSFGSVSAVQAL